MVISKVFLIGYLLFMFFYPLRGMYLFSDRILYVFGAVSYPIYKYLLESFYCHVLEIYVKDYCKEVYLFIKKKISGEVAEKVLINYFVSLKISSVKDFINLPEKIVFYLFEECELTRKQKKSLEEWFENNELESYVKKIGEKRKKRSSKVMEIHSTWDKILINMIDSDSNVNILKSWIPNKLALLMLIVIVIDSILVFVKCSYELLWAEVFLSSAYYVSFCLKKNKTYLDAAYVCFMFIFSFLIVQMCIMYNSEVFISFHSIIVITVKFMISVLFGSKWIYILDELLNKTRLTKYIDKDEIIGYKLVDYLKEVYLWIMFGIAIVFNITIFSTLLYINNTDASLTWENINAVEFICFFKCSISNFFTNDILIDLSSMNFFIKCAQNLVSYFTNILLISSIVNYIEVYTKKRI